MKQKLTFGCLVLSLAFATAAMAENRANTYSISPVIGGYTYDGHQHLDSTLVYGIRAGYNLSEHFGIEGLFDYASPTDSTTGPTKDLSMYRYGAEALYHFLPEKKLVPYLAAGVAGLNFDGNGAKRTRAAFDWGVGAKYFLNDNFALRADVRHILYKTDQTVNNLEYTLGAYIPFGGVKPAAKPVEPAPVVAQPKPAPVVAAPVVEAPVDTDRDGVIDSLDKCPGTPVGVKVDKDGCPLDSDNDGVYDYLDKCPGTPAGVKVDKDGCPLDSDKDGVYDYLDKCPGTPAGVQVDKDGCPLDSDKDGVYDYLDKCPGTPLGTKVDKDGCPEPVAAQKAAPAKLCSPAVVEIVFDTNKADIKPQYHDELNKLGQFLKDFPDAKGVIEGHTDSVGDKASNMKLSQRRAESVRNYIISTFGIAPDRIGAKGYGPTKPIADNKTAAGKQKNRRIEANFSCNSK